MPLSRVARGLSTETAFGVLAVAKKLKAAGKDVIELQIGDSPFNSTASALEAGVAAIRGNQTSPKNEIRTEKLRRLGMEFGGRQLLHQTIEQLVEVARRQCGAEDAG